jgi:ATP-dependent DNA helicase
LEKSSLYAQFLANKMERQQQEQRERAQVEEARRANAKEKAKVKQEKIAAGPTRKSTRVNTKITAVASSSSITKQPAKKKDGNNKKRKANDTDYNIADYVETNVSL